MLVEETNMVEAIPQAYVYYLFRSTIPAFHSELTWGNTYNTTLQPIYILQKKAVRVITFSSFDHHSNPLFKLLDIIIFPDLVKYYIGIFVYKYKNQLLPSVFNSFFTKVDQARVVQKMDNAIHRINRFPADIC